MDTHTDLLLQIEELAKKAPAIWLTSVIGNLRVIGTAASSHEVFKKIPMTTNADLSVLTHDVIRSAEPLLSWEALSWAIEAAVSSYKNFHEDHEIEFLWSGPSPADNLPVRRIDQTLYDLISRSNNEILLVTFAAAKIQKLSAELLKASNRGVDVKLVLEFEHTSEGQLSFDALKAFPAELTSKVKVFHWPLEMRERNAAGRPGKLHAKVAIIDNLILLSSANMTDDAFNRNLELGVMIENKALTQTAKKYFDVMIKSRKLQLI